MGLRRHAKLGLIGLAAAGFATAAWAFLAYEPFRHAGVAFEPGSGCQAAQTGMKQDSAPHTLMPEWKEGELVIRVSERGPCGAVHSVSAQVVGAHVFLNLKYGVPGRPPAACLCRHDTIVRIKPVDKRNYSIHRVGFARLGG